MFVSLNYMHYWWKNYLVVWHGPFQSKDINKLIIFQNVVSQSLLIWHAFFGLLDNNDDIIVLERSSLVTNLLQGLQTWVLLSMAIHIQRIIYLLMKSILDGAYLFKQFMNYKERNDNISLKCKESKETWNITLGCFKHILQSFKIKVDNRTWPQSKGFL